MVKANGEMAMISYSEEMDLWIIASKNVKNNKKNLKKRKNFNTPTPTIFIIFVKFIFVLH